MPLVFIAEVFENGLPGNKHLWTAVKIIPWLLVLMLLKRYFGGARNTSERNMHSKVVMMTVRFPRL